MTVGELKELLDDYGDHLTVVISTHNAEYERFDVDSGTDEAGMTAVVLEVLQDYED